MSYLCFLLLIVFVLISFSFFTIFERKVVGYLQDRKGPNKLGVMGLLQPFGDAIKLFGKELMHPMVSNYGVYLWAPLVSIFLSLFFWIFYTIFQLSTFLFGILYFVSVFVLLSTSWSSILFMGY